MSTIASTDRIPDRIVVEDVVIDLAGCRVLRGGIEVPLEPKAFAVLALLSASPGTVCSRDAILDAVWGHRHVTPGVLNRVMTLLRQALGEDAQHPRLLHTIHGVGYRFDLPSTHADTAAAKPATAVSPAPASDVGTSDPTGPGEAPRRRTVDNRRWLAGIATFTMVVLGVVAYRAWLPPGERSLPPASSATAASLTPGSPTLMVVPLRALSGDGAGLVIAEGLSEELIGALAQVNGLRVIARETTLLAVAGSDDPAYWASQAGITHALEGSLQVDGQHLRVRLRLVETGTRRATWAREFDREATQVLALQHEIAESVAVSLALRMGLRPLPGEGGDSEFLRRLHAARAQLTRRDLSIEQSVEPAEAELRALIRERPEDARAHAALARALEARAGRRPAMTTALRREAQDVAAIALRLDPSSADAKHVLARESCRSNDWSRCISLLREAKALGPNLTPVRFDLTVALARLGYLDRAEAEAREALAVDPLSTAFPFLLGRVLDTRGRHEEARASFARDPEIGGIYGRWFNAVWRGAHEEALAIAQGEMVDGAARNSDVADLQPSYLAVSQALADPSLWPDARRVMTEWERGALGRLAFHRVLDPQAEAGALVEGLIKTRRGAYSSWDLLLWTKHLAPLRREPAFQRYLREDGILAFWAAEGMPSQCRKRGDLVMCD